MIKHETWEDPHAGIIIKLLEPMSFMVGSKVLVVPAGSTSDGCSVPRWAHWIIDPVHDERTFGPGVRHDFLYEEHVVSRSDADRYLRDDLVRHKFPIFLAYIVWLAVRCFGWLYW